MRSCTGHLYRRAESVEDPGEPALGVCRLDYHFGVSRHKGAMPLPHTIICKGEEDWTMSRSSMGDHCYLAG